MGVLPICRGAVGVFYSPSWLGNYKLEYIYICVCVCLCVCLPITPYKHDVTIGKWFKWSVTVLNLVFSFSTGCHTKVKEASLPYYLPITRGRIAFVRMEYPSPALSEVDWLYVQWAQHYTCRCFGDEADGINLLLALTLASTVQQRQTWGRMAPYFGWATFGWASSNIDTLVPLV